MKALIMSFDDGLAADRRLVKLFDSVGIKGTFNLNSAKLGTVSDWLPHASDPCYVEASEVRELYQNHEVASHTLSHPVITELDLETLKKEVGNDRQALRDLSGQEVRAFAYPFGAWSAKIFPALTELGIICARTVETATDFSLPAEFLAWAPTCHYSQALGFAREFIELHAGSPSVMLVEGHSWELDGEDPAFSWKSFQKTCELLGNRDDIWYCGMAECTAWMN